MMGKQANLIVDPIASERLKLTETARNTVRAKEFSRQLSYYTRMRLTAQAEAAQQRQLAQVAMEKRQRQQRINNLLGQISTLQGQLYISGFDGNLAGQLSMLQSELLWLLCVA